MFQFSKIFLFGSFIMSLFNCNVYYVLGSWQTYFITDGQITFLWSHGERGTFAKQCLQYVAGHETVAKKQWWFYFHECIFHEVWARSLITLDLSNVFEKLSLQCCSFMVVFCSLQNHNGLKNKYDSTEKIFLCPIGGNWIKWKRQQLMGTKKTQEEVYLKDVHIFP